MAMKIEDYALIGDCQTAALVAKNGSIDWLSFPRFDSAACFAALLGSEDNGRWQIAPNASVTRVKRRYIDDTLVLETEFETETGVVAVLDFMPLRDLTPDLVRIVEGRRGRVAMHSELIIRFEYGSVMPWVQHAGDGITAIAGPNALHLHTPVECHAENFKTASDFIVDAGQRLPFVLSWHVSFDPDPPPIDPERALQHTLAWWRAWAGRCCYHAIERDLVVRSLITLKALTYAPSGGIVAAASTSLPESIGGIRNWDYRFCWLRDATLTLLTLLNAGYTEEAKAWREWLLRAVAGDPAKLQIMYGLAGERRLEEYEIPWQSGYEGSRPVRVGNAASSQFQMDVYGEVCDALHQTRISSLNPAPAGWALERALVRFVETAWEEPDEGLWEMRGPRRHFTHSKVMAWVALDRAIKSAERFGLDAPLKQWRKVRQTIHEHVMQYGFNSRMNSFVQTFGSNRLDASLLMIPIVGFLAPSDPRVRGTVDAIEKHLMRDRLVLRYDTWANDDGLPPGEGAFLACSFWLADNYALLGEREKAQALFDRLVSLCNDVGLLAEEYDPLANRFLGNFPQAFSHVGLVNTAMNLSHADSGPATQRKNS